MSKITPLQNTWAMGIKRDIPRSNLPQGASWDSVNLVPDKLNAPLRMRGSLEYFTRFGSGTASTATVCGVYAPFAGSSNSLIFDPVGTMALYGDYSVIAGSAAVAGLVSEAVFYDDKVIIAYANGTSSAKAITGSSASLGAVALTAAPAGRFITVFKDVIWLGGASATPDRIYFSDPGDVTSWDLVDGWLDVSEPITGLASMKNVVFVFCLDRAVRIRGSIPPPGGDLATDDPLFNEGCTDHRSICYYEDRVIWANAKGIYLSDGSAIQDVTDQCEMKTWWSAVMAGTDGISAGSAYDRTTHQIVCGTEGKYLFYNISMGDVLRDAGFINLETYSWHRITMPAAGCAWSVPAPQALLFGQTGAANAGIIAGEGE